MNKYKIILDNNNNKPTSRGFAIAAQGNYDVTSAETQDKEDTSITAIAMDKLDMYNQIMDGYNSNHGRIGLTTEDGGLVFLRLHHYYRIDIIPLGEV